MKLKNSKIQTLHRAMSQFEPSAISGQQRWNILLDVETLESIVVKLEEQRVKLVKEGLNGDPELTPAAKEVFIQKFSEILEAETEVELLTKLTKQELNLDKNQVPIWILRELKGVVIVG